MHFNTTHLLSKNSQKKITMGSEGNDSIIIREITYYDSDTNSNVTDSTGWAWADPVLCDTSVYQNDPWACNFLRY